MMRKVYIVKYALTKGIIETEVDEAKITNDYIVIRNDMFYLGTAFKVNSEIFLDKQQAIMKAKQMIERKIKNLAKQIEILKKKTFD